VPQKYADIAFTPSVRTVQDAQRGRRRVGLQPDPATPDDLLGEDESTFISARDSFYMATVSETGWPYVQHRGGPMGFIKVLDRQRIAFADYRGNRQYVSVGNLSKDDRVALILVDYPARARLKLLGHVTLVTTDDEALLQQLTNPQYGATVERAFVIHVSGYDWNCPQHITPRFTIAQVEQATESLRERVRMLEAELRTLRAHKDGS
jgi:predicted pyridoxine 5'-phosphate oxidase superfamily flavin-nucleotide-binding protein